MRRKSPIKNQHNLDKNIHRKEIEKTLNELHRLQSEINELNVEECPHGSGPIKKQIKQLAYLYQNMNKPKQKNNLNISMEDIKTFIKVINVYSDNLDVKKLKDTMKHIYNHQFDVSLITQSNSKTITPQQLQNFVNYNEFDAFDPIGEAWKLLQNEKGQFDFNKFNEFNLAFGLPLVKNKATLFASLQCQQIGFQQFKNYCIKNQKK